MKDPANKDIATLKRVWNELLDYAYVIENHPNRLSFTDYRGYVLRISYALDGESDTSMKSIKQCKTALLAYQAWIESYMPLLKAHYMLRKP